MVWDLGLAEDVDLLPLGELGGYHCCELQLLVGVLGCAYFPHVLDHQLREMDIIGRYEVKTPGGKYFDGPCYIQFTEIDEEKVTLV